MCNHELFTSKIWISLRKGVFECFDPCHIIYIQAVDHYMKINLSTEDHFMLKDSLSSFYEEHLKDYKNFYRLSRTYIINLNKVKRIEGSNLYLENGIYLPIPQNKKVDVLGILGINKSQLKI